MIQIPYNFKPRWYQVPLWRYMQKGGFRKKRAVAVWHRRAGKDLNCINLCASSMLERPGLYWHMFPTYAQGKKIAWDGQTRDGRPFPDHFHPSLIGSKNHTEMKIRIDKLSSTFQVVGADKPDSLVGANPVGIIFSEWSLMNPKVWELTQPILAENEGWALFIYTPRGMNHGYDMLEAAENNSDWFSQVLPNSVTKVVSDEAIQEMRDSGMPEAMIEQEMECSFETPVVGSYYGGILRSAKADGRVTNVPWEPKLPVHTSWDLGVGDSTSIWFLQAHDSELRVIDFYENSGEGIAHYVKELDKKPYKYGMHFAPHDIEVKSLSTGEKRIVTAAKLGIRFRTVSKDSVEEGIEAVRNLLARCYFDQTKCKMGLRALTQYHKEWDDDKKVYKNKPDHDWSSHAADSFRTFAMGFRRVISSMKKGGKQTVAVGATNYDPFSRI